MSYDLLSSAKSMVYLATPFPSSSWPSFSQPSEVMLLVWAPIGGLHQLRSSSPINGCSQPSNNCRPPKTEELNAVQICGPHRLLECSIWQYMDPYQSILKSNVSAYCFFGVFVGFVSFVLDTYLTWLSITNILRLIYTSTRYIHVH